MVWIKGKQFFKNSILFLMTVIYFVWISNQLFSELYHNENMLLENILKPMDLIPLSFVFFLFLSYAFFSKDKNCRMDEVISVSGTGKIKSYVSGCVILFLIDLIIVLFLFGYFTYCCVQVLGTVDGTMFVFVVRLYGIHIFLVNLFSVLLGMSMSFVRSEMKAYIFLIVICCCFSQFFLSSLYRLSEKNETLYHFVDLFGLTTRTHNGLSVDVDYLFSVEAVNFQRIMFWIFLMVTIFLFQTLKRRKKCWIIGSGVITLLFLWFYMLPSGASYSDVASRMDAWEGEEVYYSTHQDQVGTHDNYLPKENFRILKYVANLKIRRVLEAEVSVFVDRGELSEYIFALRHEYKVSHVKDERGEDVTFEQDGDRLIVKTGEGGNHSYFTFRYEGASKVFYSTKQAVRLPACFAYLPFSGERYLYFNWERKDEQSGWRYVLYCGSAQEGMGYEAEYDITVDTTQSVYSNLPEVGKNHFHGASDGATLIANPYLRKKQIGGTTFIASRWTKFVREEEQWREFIDANSLSGKTVFSVGGKYLDDVAMRYFGKDHLVLNVPCTEEYQYYLKTGEFCYTYGQIQGLDEEALFAQSAEETRQLEEMAE